MVGFLKKIYCIKPLMYDFIIFMEISEIFCLPDLPLHKAV